MFPLKNEISLGFVQQVWFGCFYQSLTWTQANHCATSGISLVTRKSTAGSTDPFATNFQELNLNVIFKDSNQHGYVFLPQKDRGFHQSYIEVIVKFGSQNPQVSGAKI